MGVDFKGGYSYNIQFDENQKVDVDALRTSLKDAFGGATPVVKEVDASNTYNVTTSYLIDQDVEKKDSLVMVQLYEGANNFMGGNLNYEGF